MVRVVRVDRNGEPNGAVVIDTAGIYYVEQRTGSAIATVYMKGGVEFFVNFAAFSAVVNATGWNPTSIPYRSRGGDQIGVMWFLTSLGLNIMTSYSKKQPATNLRDPEDSLVKVALEDGSYFYADKVEWEDYLVTVGTNEGPLI